MIHLIWIVPMILVLSIILSKPKKKKNKWSNYGKWRHPEQYKKLK